MHTSSMFLPAYESLPARRARWVVSPFGSKRLGDTSGDDLTLLTIQSSEAYRILCRDGVLRADPELRDSDFIEPYAWMEKVAEERLPTRGSALLWLWAQTTRKQIRLIAAPHARSAVLLTVRADRSEVLLSHFDEWHSCLNNGPVILPQPGETDDAWWARAAPIIDEFRAARDATSKCAAGSRLRLEQTWESILDQSWWTPNDYIQAVAHEIRADQVTRAVKIR